MGTYIVTGAFFATALIGCRKPIEVPPITQSPTGSYIEGKFVWEDLLTHDVSAARKFYGRLFGWEFEGADTRDAPFTLIKQNGVPIGGIFYFEQLDPRKKESRWLQYISVPDVDKACEAVRANGGVVFREPFDLPQRGRVAVVLDPQGAAFAFLKATGGDPADEKVSPMRWMWNELWTTDTASARPFYEKVLGYSVQKPEQLGDAYQVFNRDGVDRAGMVQFRREGVHPLWLPYVNVDDPRALAEKALTLGGEIHIAPDTLSQNGTVAVIGDPTGGVLAIEKWTPGM